MFKKKFRAEMNFKNYFIPIRYWRNFYWIGTKPSCICFWHIKYILLWHPGDMFILFFKGLKEFMKYMENCWRTYQRQTDCCLKWYYSFNLFILSFGCRGSDGSTDCLKFLNLKSVFWALYIILNVLLWLLLQTWHAYLICESKSA